MPDPVVSVVVPIYNAARYLESALRSVLQQSFADFELIAVDDGSTDPSRTILERLAAEDPRVRVVSRPNTGIVGALNDGLALARGEFVARMDADDLCFPQRFAVQVDHLRRHPECVCVGSAFLYIDAEGYCLKEVPRPRTHAEIEAELLQGNGGSLIHPTAMFRRNAVDQVGRYREKAQWIEDLDLYLRLARVGTLANLPDVLLQYRLHEKSVNFTRNQGRLERKWGILAEAYAARGLAFDRNQLRPPVYTDAITRDNFNEFAVTSLKYGAKGRPWYYVFRSLRAGPLHPQSWRVASYVAKHALGLIRT